MSPLPATRKAKLYAAAVAGAAALVVFGQPAENTSAVAPAPRHLAAAKSAPSRLTPDAAAFLTRLAHRSTDPASAHELFASRSWYVPPPPPPPPPPPGPPPPPTAPPLPYAFIGSYAAQGDAATYFITRGDRIYDVKVGDSIDGEYSLDAVEGSNLIFTYKPLKQRQSLTAGVNP